MYKADAITLKATAVALTASAVGTAPSALEAKADEQNNEADVFLLK